MAEAARHKHEGKKYESREVRAGLKIRRDDFKTIRELCNWYMEIPAIQEKRGYSRKVRASANLLEYFGDKPVNSVEGDEQERYRQIRQSHGAAAATVDVEISLLSAMYHQALKWKRINPESMPGEFIIRHDRNPRRLIRDDEYKSLLEQAVPYFRDFLVCAYESAMRSSEICGLTAGQVHLDEIRISGGQKVLVDYIDLGIFDNKNHTRRTVPVSPILKEILARRLQGLEAESRVFTAENGRPFTNCKVSHRLGRLCEKVKVIYGDKPTSAKGERTGIVFHCFRHTRTSKWVDLGYSDEIIRRATGHLNLEAYRTCVKLDPSVVMRLVQDGSAKTGIKTAESLVG